MKPRGFAYNEAEPLCLYKANVVWGQTGRACDRRMWFVLVFSYAPLTDQFMLYQLD